ncbi:MAG: dihydrolipoyl dehydrogenase [Rhodobacter sp.]|nr:dihydrolipoyl dehydrogenase [Rhodobacter sp.]MCY4168841.1 dihydrolipoyl dehydrogenase [Rhodobacter sp.]
MSTYDVIVIGAGPGGYVCAIRCAQLGLKTACAEGRETLGGTCLNAGCIPSKALLHASHSLYEATHNFARMGLKTTAPKVEWDAMLAYKDDAISQNTKGIEFLFRKNKVDWLKGWASIPAAGQVSVAGQTHEARAIVIATGSDSATIPGVEIDERTVVSSTGALELQKIPGKLLVIGAGVIGLELGSVYSRLGSEVTVIEFQDRILPGADGEIAGTFRKILGKQGLKFITGAAVRKVDATETGARTTYGPHGSNEEATLETDTVLVATGRRPFTRGLELDRLGVNCSKGGQIVTDSRYATNVDGIYAIGDCVDGPMLAHKAEDEGMAVAENLAGQAGHVNHDVIPGVIYTHPEVASVGETEESLKERGRAYKAGRFSFMGNGRAKATFSSDGLVKLLADAGTDRILGCHIIGPAAGDLIHEVCVAMEFGAAAEDLARTCHAHPTYSEAVREAALACGDGAIHA